MKESMNYLDFIRLSVPQISWKYAQFVNQNICLKIRIEIDSNVIKFNNLALLKALNKK